LTHGKALAAVLAITASLLLGGCGADYGVDQHGNTVKSEQIDGHWLVLNYWAEWCGPCRTKSRTQCRGQAVGGQGIKVFGVNFDGLQGADLKAPATRWASPSPCWPRTRPSARPAAQRSAAGDLHHRRQGQGA
jgi:hypothetical protein